MKRNTIFTREKFYIIVAVVIVILWVIFFSLVAYILNPDFFSFRVFLKSFVGSKTLYTIGRVFSWLLFFVFLILMYDSYKKTIEVSVAYNTHYDKWFSVYNKVYQIISFSWLKNKTNNLIKKKQKPNKSITIDKSSKDFSNLNQSCALILHKKVKTDVFFTFVSSEEQFAHVNRLNNMLIPLFAKLKSEEIPFLKEKEIFDIELEFFSDIKDLFLTLKEEDLSIFILIFKAWFSLDSHIQNRIDCLFLHLKDKYSLEVVTKFFTNVSNKKKKEGLQVLFGSELKRIKKDKVRVRERLYRYSTRLFNIHYLPVQFSFLFVENRVQNAWHNLHECVNGYNNPNGSVIASEFVDMSNLIFDTSTYVELTGLLGDIENKHSLLIKSYEENEETENAFSLFDFNTGEFPLIFKGASLQNEIIQNQIFVRVFFNTQFLLSGIIYYYNQQQAEVKHPKADLNQAFFVESYSLLTGITRKDPLFGSSSFTEND